MLEQILELSPSGEPYHWFCKHLLPCVVGAKLWHKKHNKELIGTIASCSDEAFALLTLENNYERWMAVARWHVDNANMAPENKAPKHFPGSLYTTSGFSIKKWAISLLARVLGARSTKVICSSMHYTTKSVGIAVIVSSLKMSF
jgi:hypothetical protein